MKKRTVRFLAVLLLVVLFLSALTGCMTEQKEYKRREPNASTAERGPLLGKTDTEKAFYLWNHQEMLAPKEAYSVDMTFWAEGDRDGIPFTMSGSGSSTVILSDSETFYYDDITQTIEIGDGLYVAEMVQKSGYADGKMFSYQSQDGVGEGVYSEISVEDWREYYQRKQEDTFLQLTEADVKNVTFKLVKGGCKATFSQFTQDGLEKMNNSLGISMPMGRMPSDLKITLTVDTELRPTKLVIQLIYDAEEGTDAPEFLMEGVYRDDHQVKSFPVNLTGYRDVGDLRIAEDLKTRLDDLAYQSEVSCQHLETSALLLNRSEVLSSSILRTDMSLTNDEDGFSFEVSGNVAHMFYKNGTLTMESEDYRQESTLSESEARLLIRQWYDPVSFDIYFTEKTHHFQGNGKEEYSVYLSYKDLSIFQSVLDEYEMTEKDLQNVAAVYSFSFTDGIMTYLQYSVSAELVIGSDVLNLDYMIALDSLSYSE